MTESLTDVVKHSFEFFVTLKTATRGVNDTRRIARRISCFVYLGGYVRLHFPNFPSARATRAVCLGHLDHILTTMAKFRAHETRKRKFAGN